MADIPVKIYRSSQVRPNTSPTNPSFPADQDPVIENPAGTGTPDHNSLNGLQGGNATERYHLTKDKAEAAEAANAPTSGNPFATVLDLDDYVPYLSATQDVDLGVQGITTEWVKLNTTPVIPTDQGSLYWDEDDNVLAVVLNGAIQKVGEVTFYNVKNQTGSTIPKGTGVGFAGVVGLSGRIKVAPFLADGSQPSIYYVGITAEAILNGEDGKVYNFGPIRGLNTSAFSEGDVLYASSTVAGGFTTTPPTAPNNVIVVAAVLADSATVGALLVRVTVGDLVYPEAVERENNTVLFDKDYVIGNATARTGNILFDFTGAKLMGTTMMLHNSGTAPTFPAQAVKLGGEYELSANNYIYFQLTRKTASSEIVLYTISQVV
jgi:hypothetical protein